MEYVVGATPSITFIVGTIVFIFTVGVFYFNISIGIFFNGYATNYR
jgi:hypothetical protein